MCCRLRWGAVRGAPEDEKLGKLKGGTVKESDNYCKEGGDLAQQRVLA